MGTLRKRNSQSRAYEHIKQRIISLAVAPGMPLRAQEIAAKLKVSRTPVREALSKLEQEGLVLRQNDWGYVVRPMSPKDILDLFTIRESLEVQAAREALPRVDRDELRELEAHLDRAESLLEEQRYPEFRAACREFHLAIAELSENELLFRLLATIRDRILIVGAMHQDTRPERAREVLAENKKILQAFGSGNAKSVVEAVLQHIRASRASILPAQAASARGAPRRTGLKV